MKEIIQQGVDFIGAFVKKQELLAEYGPDILFLFQHISQTTVCTDLKNKTQIIGAELAKLWRAQQNLPQTPYQLLSTLIAEQAAHDLGNVDFAFRTRLHNRITMKLILDVLGFDPRVEPPPANLTDDCQYCQLINPPGRTYCAGCRKKLVTISKYDVWLNALVMTHHLKLYGPIGRELYSDTLAWIDEMRPYPQGQLQVGNEVWEAAYAITHIIYTLNDYGLFKLTRSGLDIEVTFLKRILCQALEIEDCDLLGECVESLSFLGFSKRGPLLKNAVDYLLKKQNDDGSWGDISNDDHLRIHTTWTAIDGIREFRLNRKSVSLKSNLEKRI